MFCWIYVLMELEWHLPQPEKRTGTLLSPVRSWQEGSCAVHAGPYVSCLAKLEQILLLTLPEACFMTTWQPCSA